MEIADTGISWVYRKVVGFDKIIAYQRTRDFSHYKIPLSSEVCRRS